jgi:hypothetical protein
MSVPGEPGGKLGDVIEWAAIGVMVLVSIAIPVGIAVWTVSIIR